MNLTNTKKEFDSSLCIHNFNYTWFQNSSHYENNLFFCFNCFILKVCSHFAFCTMLMFSQKTHIWTGKKKPIVFRSRKSHSQLGKLISILNRPLEVGLHRLYFLAGIITGFLLILIIGLSPSSVRLPHTMEEAKIIVCWRHGQMRSISHQGLDSQSFMQIYSLPFLPGNYSEIKTK